MSNHADETYSATSQRKVRSSVRLGPPIVTFPHQKVEAFFEVSIAHASNKEGVGHGPHR